MALSETTIHTEYETSTSTDTSKFENLTNIDFGLTIHVDAFDAFQIILLTIGVIGNILILVVLLQSKGHLQLVTLTLVKHQSVIDAFVCVTLTVRIVIPRYWTSGFYYIDVFLCHLFHTDGEYFYRLSL